MMSYSSLAELLRRSALGDPVSKISVALDIPESTLRDWLEFAKQNKLDYETLSTQIFQPPYVKLQRVAEKS